MNFFQAIKLFNEGIVITRNNFKYQKLNTERSNKLYSVVLCEFFRHNGEIEKFWVDHTDAVFTLQDVESEDWEIFDNQD